MLLIERLYTSPYDTHRSAVVFECLDAVTGIDRTVDEFTGEDEDDLVSGSAIALEDVFKYGDLTDTRDLGV